MDRLISAFPFGALFAVIAAAACYRAVTLQSRGVSVRPWQIGIAPVFGCLAAAAMLYRASLATPCLSAWALVLLGGAAIGAVTARSISLQVDHVWRRVRVNWGMDGLLVACVILFAAGSGALLGIFSASVLVWACATALVSGFGAGLLGGRAWAIAKRIAYSADTELV